MNEFEIDVSTFAIYVCNFDFSYCLYLNIGYNSIDRSLAFVEG